MLKKVYLFLALTVLCMCMFACGEKEEPAAKVRDLDFTVVATENIPEELLSVLEEKKEESFYHAYSDGDFMYLCVGYGQQETGGYSITVDALYLTEESVCMGTTLVGPEASEKNAETPSYPYVVVCTEYIDKPILFE